MDIQPFTINIPQDAIDDLKYRLTHARLPHELPNVGWSRGVPRAYLEELTAYWRDEYDWRQQEARLNQFPQFTTEVDGQTIHFLHVRSPEPNAIPLVLAHGYPSSFVEFLNVIELLTNPRAFGGDPADAFHVVVPSLPGYGFSTPLRDTGWEVRRTGKAFVELMRRLGYARYAVQGGDIGSGVIGEMSRRAPESVIGLHLITDTNVVMMAGSQFPIPESLPDTDKTRIKEMAAARAEGTGYLAIQSTRPQTIGYALVDSPVGQLAWIVEKYKEWLNPAKDLPEDAMDRDQMLTNISLYWFNQLGPSAANFIYEAFHTQFEWSEGSAAPVGYAAFDPEHIARRLIDPDNQIPHWSNFDEGGHFPAMEVPDVLVGDIRTFFRSLR